MSSSVPRVLSRDIVSAPMDEPTTRRCRLMLPGLLEVIAVRVMLADSAAVGTLAHITIVSQRTGTLGWHFILVRPIHIWQHALEVVDVLITLDGSVSDRL